MQPGAKRKLADTYGSLCFLMKYFYPVPHVINYLPHSQEIKCRGGDWHIIRTGNRQYLKNL